MRRGMENSNLIQKTPTQTAPKSTLATLAEQNRQQWRQSEHDRLKAEADHHKERHKELSAKEPKAFFKTAKFTREHNEWVEGTNRIRQELIDALEAAKAALEGKSAKEYTLKPQFEQQAREMLKKQHPELDKALTDAHEELKRKHRVQQQQTQNTKEKSKGQDLDIDW